MAKFSKDERRARVKQWQATERTELLASMPLSPQQLNSLLEYLYAKLESCDHTAKLTAIFLHVERLDKHRVLTWLAEHGGYCDCEVLHNLRDLAGSFREQPTPPRSTPKTRRAARDLTTLTGWDFSALPKPWRIVNLYSADEPLRIGMGKKSGCTIALIESAMPPGNQISDDYWAALWYARTELPKRSPVRVARAMLDLPNQFQSTLVQTSCWTPVYCWIVPDDQNWYLEVQTQLNRQEGDLPQVAKLVNQLATNAGRTDIRPELA